MRVFGRRVNVSVAGHDDSALMNSTNPAVATVRRSIEPGGVRSSLAACGR
jgi:hypothetical protein